MTATVGCNAAAAATVAGPEKAQGADDRTMKKPISSHPLYDVDDEGHTLSLVANCRAQPNCVRGRAAASTFRKPSLTAAAFANPTETVSSSGAAATAAGITAAAAGVPVGGSRGRDGGREGKGPDVDSLLFDLD